MRPPSRPILVHGVNVVVHPPGDAAGRLRDADAELGAQPAAPLHTEHGPRRHRAGIEEHAPVVPAALLLAALEAAAVAEDVVLEEAVRAFRGRVRGGAEVHLEAWARKC